MSQTSPLSVDFINPFIRAVVTVPKTTASLEVRPGKPSLKEPDQPAGDVTGLIGMAGEECNGSLAIVFPRACALEVVSSMLCEEITEITSDILDGVGELTNQICGQAKVGLSERGHRFEQVIPGVVKGRDHTIQHRTAAPVVVVPFEISSGAFFVEASFEIRGDS